MEKKEKGRGRGMDSRGEAVSATQSNSLIKWLIDRLPCLYLSTALISEKSFTLS